MMFVLVESIRVAWLGIVGNKLRTFLTMLGVIIGIASVIGMVSIGQGAQAKATQQIQALGTNLITVNIRSNAFRIEPKDMVALKDQVEGVLFVLPSVTSAAQTVKSDTDTTTVDIEGTSADFPAVRDRGLATGNWFSDQDVTTRRLVAVIGTTTATNLFGNANPMGRQIRFLSQSFTIVGVAESKGTGFGGQDQDDRIFVPYTALSRLVGLNRIPSLTLKTDPSADSAVATQEVTDYFTNKFRLTTRNVDALRVQSQDQLLQTVGSLTQTFTLLLGAIASISLAVGGIGIMNIMLVSVSERTREIGIRKAIGAKRRDILLQFLIEALILSGSGGAVGVGIGIAIAHVLANALSFPSGVTLNSVVIAFGFSAAIGVIFGLYPAYRASNLDPIDALRRD
jgi:putative ABC transport system permease protein